jgi:hypothetical protein
MARETTILDRTMAASTMETGKDQTRDNCTSKKTVGRGKMLRKSTEKMA